MRIFLSHSSKDKREVRKLAHDLEQAGVEVWLDEWEIKVGESISQSVETGITEADYVAVWLTKNAVESGWVQTEWRMKLSHEISSKEVRVLPLLAEDCDIPLILSDKKRADFRQYEIGFQELTSSLGISKPIRTPIQEPDEDLTKLQLFSLLTAFCAIGALGGGIGSGADGILSGGLGAGLVACLMWGYVRIFRQQNTIRISWRLILTWMATGFSATQTDLTLVEPTSWLASFYPAFFGGCCYAAVLYYFFPSQEIFSDTKAP
ncbi:MAG: toll/interleukin-1 receptor domain-containing protein [Verrucomicrobiota bacterium]